MSHKYFIAVGRLEYQKGFDLLIDIFYKFKQYPDVSHWRLLLVGEGNQRKNLEAKIQKLNLTEEIILIGATRDVNKYYAMSEIFLMSSRWEGMPLVIDEAMFFQLPIIAFDCETGPREMIDDGVNGFLVPLGQSDRFVEIMLSLVRDNLLLAKIKQNCTSSIERRSDRAILDKWNSLFNRLAKQQ
jgi:glycosyltransferase involved in cell wall biosynthesis